jgi:5-methylcytosine-specific restriction endonuclease McrA
MPTRFCLEPDCRKLTTAGSRCPDCQAKLVKRMNAAKGSRHTRGLGYDHVRRAKALLATAQVCEICGQPPTPTNPLTAHHTTARAKGGANSELVAACRHCNSSIGDRT